MLAMDLLSMGVWKRKQGKTKQSWIRGPELDPVLDYVRLAEKKLQGSPYLPSRASTSTLAIMAMERVAPTIVDKVPAPRSPAFNAKETAIIEAQDTNWPSEIREYPGRR